LWSSKPIKGVQLDTNTEDDSRNKWSGTVWRR
jgi:hypothetical protein